MPADYEIPVYRPSQLYEVTGWHDVTWRSWKRRGVTEPLDIRVSGNRSLYSFTDVVQLAIAAKLIERGFDARNAFEHAADCGTAVSAMLGRKNEWRCWIVLSFHQNLSQPRGVETNFNENIADLVQDIEDAIVLNVAQIARRVQQTLERTQP